MDVFGINENKLASTLKTLSEFLVLCLLLVTTSTKGQSFIVKKSGEIVKCSKIIVRNKVLILNDENSLKILKIEKDLLAAYYQDFDNAYYENIDGFKEEVVSGKIKIYRGEAFVDNPTPGERVVNNSNPSETFVADPNSSSSLGFGPMPVQYTKWYIEKDGLLIEAFDETHGHISYLNEDKIQDILDESLSKKIFRESKKKRKLENLLRIFA